MKKIGFKYFFILFISVLSCFGVYTKSIQNTGKIFSHYVVRHAEVNDGRKHHLTQSTLTYDVEFENVEIGESEIDETDFEISLYDVNFYSKFLNNLSSFNLLHTIKNGLKECLHVNYLTSIQSYTVLFCNYRL